MATERASALSAERRERKSAAPVRRLAGPVLRCGAGRAEEEVCALSPAGGDITSIHAPLS